MTGGASNIGRAIALTFGEEGADIIIVDLDRLKAERTADEIRSSGGTANVEVVDVADAGACQAAADRLDADQSIDILVNNVGWNGKQEFFLQLGPQRWDMAYRRNLLPTFCMTHAVLPHMVRRRAGSIVSISSTAAFGDYRVADYGAMKAGIHAFSQAIAKEYGRYGIRSNVVAPGMVIPADDDIGDGSYWNCETGVGEREIADIEARTPLKRRPDARDVAQTAVFLASECARQLTGQLVSVAGGFAMPR